MIQRIQTLYLALAAACLSGTFALPFARTLSPTAEGQLFRDGRYDLHDHPALLLLAATGILCATAAIFLFKNRPLQMRLALLSLLATAALVLLALVLFWNETALFGEASPTPSMGSALPVAAAFLLVLARRHIKKDEELVQSMDRLR